VALQFRRGTAANRTANNFTPVVGEPIYETDTKKLFIGDGSTVGGVNVNSGFEVADLGDVTLTSETITNPDTYSVTSNTLTLVFDAGHSFTASQSISIASSSVTALNGSYTVSSVTTTNVVMPITGVADTSSSSLTADVFPNIIDGHALVWDASNSYWKNVAPFSDIVEDTTPQLGGNLDVNGNNIISTGNNDINLDPAVGQDVVIKGNATDGAGKLVLNCENNSHGIKIKGPPHSAAANYTLTLPNDDGDAGEFLQSDGAGVLSFAVPAQKYTKFKFNLAAAPTGAVTGSQIVGQESTLGSWSELTFANYSTNGIGPSENFDPTLSGIAHSSGDFVGFEAGVYKIDVSLEVIIAGLANNSYNRYDHEIRPLSDTTQLPGITQDFNFTCNATAPTGNTTQRVSMSLIVHLENATAANNKIQFYLNSDQSNNYYCNSALATFTKIG
jgi:hypothetical protein|tara:strand:+ start:5548 stop:6882 length:1335 start_codon:yes stop_codon:yes gene_type:complete